MADGWQHAAVTDAGISLASAFVPVQHPPTAAGWYAEAFGATVEEATEHAAVLRLGTGLLTLMGPASGIRATPGLPWSPVSFRADDLEAARARLAATGAGVSTVQGSADRCLFLTVDDPDGNVLLVVDR